MKRSKCFNTHVRCVQRTLLKQRRDLRLKDLNVYLNICAVLDIQHNFDQELLRFSRNLTKTEGRENTDSRFYAVRISLRSARKFLSCDPLTI